MARKHPNDEPAQKPILAESATQVLRCCVCSTCVYLGSFLLLDGHLRHSGDCLETLGTSVVLDPPDLLRRSSSSLDLIAPPTTRYRRCAGSVNMLT